MAWLERVRLAIRQLGVRAVGLVGGGDHDPPRAVQPACLEHRPGAAHVRLERRQRAAISCRHEGLRREVEHRLDLVLRQRARDQAVRADITMDHFDAALEIHQLQRGAARGIAFDHDHACAPVEQRPDEPRAEQPVRAGHENAVAQFHSFQGALPAAHRSFRSSASL